MKDKAKRTVIIFILFTFGFVASYAYIHKKNVKIDNHMNPTSKISKSDSPDSLLDNLSDFIASITESLGISEPIGVDFDEVTKDASSALQDTKK